MFLSGLTRCWLRLTAGQLGPLSWFAVVTRSLHREAWPRLSPISCADSNDCLLLTRFGTASYTVIQGFEVWVEADSTPSNFGEYRTKQSRSATTDTILAIHLAALPFLGSQPSVRANFTCTLKTFSIVDMQQSLENRQRQHLVSIGQSRYVDRAWRLLPIASQYAA